MKDGLSSSASAAPRRIRKAVASSGRIAACATRLPSGSRCARLVGMVQQVSRRTREGAGDEDPLFPNSEGGFASKSEAARTLKKLLVPDGPGEIGGHSMRRCGAQTLTQQASSHGRWSGLDAGALQRSGRTLKTREPVPQTCRSWRSGSSNLKQALLRVAQVKHNRLQACRKSRRLERTGAQARGATRRSKMGLARGSPASRVACPPTAVLQTSRARCPCSEGGSHTQDCAKVVKGIIAEQFAGRDRCFRCASQVFGKTHLALVPAATGNWRGQVGPCGWHFGALRSEAYSARHQEGHGGQPWQEMPVEGSISNRWSWSLGLQFGTGLREPQSWPGFRV